jgi:hypothetical protein
MCCTLLLASCYSRTPSEFLRSRKISYRRVIPLCCCPSVPLSSTQIIPSSTPTPNLHKLRQVSLFSNPKSYHKPNSDKFVFLSALCADHPTSIPFIPQIVCRWRSSFVSSSSSSESSSTHFGSPNTFGFLSTHSRKPAMQIIFSYQVCSSTAIS